MDNEKREIIAELKRRGVKIPDKYRHLETEKEALPVRAIRSLSEKIVQHPGLNEKVNRAGQAVQPINESITQSPLVRKYLAPYGAGVTQTAADMGISLANIPREMTGREPFKHPNFQQHLAQDYSPVANIAGMLHAGILGGTKGYNTAVGALPKLAGAPGVLLKALTGGLTGAALSEGSPGGRPLGFGLGLIPTGPSLTNKNVGNKIAEGFKESTEKFKQLYGNVFKGAEKQGINVIKPEVSEQVFENLMKELPGNVSKSLTKWKKNPSFENAHWLQSALKKFSNKILDNTQALPGVKDAARNAKNLADKLNESIFSSLKEKGGMDLLFDYMGLGKRYAQEHVPYYAIKDIEKAAKNPKMKGAINPSRLPQSLDSKNADYFKANLGHLYPELDVNRMLADPNVKNLLMKLAEGSAIGGGAVGAGYGLYSLLGNKD